jgi:putative addiction module antidote
MYPLKIVPVGDALGIVFPPEMAARLDLRAGNYLFAEATDDGIWLTKADAEFEAQMEVARDVMRKHDGVLRELKD